MASRRRRRASPCRAIVELSPRRDFKFRGVGAARGAISRVGLAHRALFTHTRQRADAARRATRARTSRRARDRDRDRAATRTTTTTNAEATAETSREEDGAYESALRRVMSNLANEGSLEAALRDAASAVARGGGRARDGGGATRAAAVGENRDEVMLAPGTTTVGGDKDDLRRASAAVGTAGELAGTDEGALAFARLDLLDDEFFVLFVVFVDVDVDGGVDVVVAVHVAFASPPAGDEGLLVSPELSRRRGRRGSVSVAR